MATYRQVYLSFWTDPKVDDDFTPEDKYFYLYLLTNPHTNICGCYEIGMKQICREMGYNEDTILRLISRMENQHHVIRYDQKTKEVLLLNWHKYNWTRSPDMLKGVKEVSQYIKSENFRNEVFKMIECFENKTVYRPSLDGRETSVSVSDTVTVSVSDNKEKKTKFSEFAGDDAELLKALNEFAAMRKQIKKPLTQGAVDRLLHNLSKFSREEWIPILNQSTDHCWQDIYALKTAPAPAGNAVGRTGQMLQDSYRMMEEWANG